MSGRIMSTAGPGAGMRTCTVPAIQCRMTQQQAKACRLAPVGSSISQPGNPTGSRTVLLLIAQHQGLSLNPAEPQVSTTCGETRAAAPPVRFAGEEGPVSAGQASPAAKGSPVSGEPGPCLAACAEPDGQGRSRTKVPRAVRQDLSRCAVTMARRASIRSPGSLSRSTRSPGS